jgi:hypothetical protein
MAAVVNKVAANQHGEHENPHIVVLSLFHVTKALSVDKEHVDGLPVSGFDWNRLIPKPETLCVGSGFASYSKSILVSNQLVDDERLSSAVKTSDRNDCDWSWNSSEHYFSFFIDNVLCMMLGFRNLLKLTSSSVMNCIAFP